MASKKEILKQQLETERTNDRIALYKREIEERTGKWKNIKENMWSIILGRVEISVHHHKHFPGKIVASFRPSIFNCDVVELKTNTFEEAKKEIIKVVEKWSNEFQTAIESYNALKSPRASACCLLQQGFKVHFIHILYG